LACGALALFLAGCAAGRPSVPTQVAAIATTVPDAPNPPVPAAAPPAPASQAYAPDPTLPGAAGVINFSYEPGRDAAADIKQALALAAASGRRVLVEVGGPWCSWCGIMDRFFAADAQALALRDAAFVTVKVFSRPSAPNPALAGYSKPAGYPHLYVLAPDGAVLESRDTTTLEAGLGYDSGKMAVFLEGWENSISRK
jgi:hypothetical protein